VVTTTPLLDAAQQRARLDARAALTARLDELPCWGSLAVEACWWSLPAALDELTAVTTTAVRVAAAALGCEPATLLGALLVARTAAAYEPAEQVRREAEGR